MQAGEILVCIRGNPYHPVVRGEIPASRFYGKGGGEGRGGEGMKTKIFPPRNFPYGVKTFLQILLYAIVY